ncbi:MAG: hypothetical protein O3B24_09745 [Verrucomicrobia bacterium]|nr:hypothetical protein [Verrucomicrobiota bacterium]
MNLALRSTPLTKRIRQLEKELSKVDGNIRDISRVLDGSRPGQPRRSEAATPSDAARLPEVRSSEPHARDAVRLPRDGRFADYLSPNLDRPSLPLRHERSVQRNKALVMLCLVVIVLYWIVHRWLF